MTEEKEKALTFEEGSHRYYSSFFTNMRLYINRIPLLYLYLSAFPLQSSSFSSLRSTSSFHRMSPTLSTLAMSSSSSSTTSKNNIGLSEIGSSTNADNTNNIDESTSPISSWRDKIEISIAKSRKIKGGNYVQIATVDPTTLEPRCRTIVFRGFLKSDPSEKKADSRGDDHLVLPCIMKMITDRRSNKFQEVTSREATATAATESNGTKINSAEMVWWFSKSSEQYRIRGQLKFVGADETNPYLLQSRKEQWGNLSDMAREQFYWQDPGLTYDNMHMTATIPAGGRDEDGKVLPAPENFLLMLLYPTRCDYLRLRDNFRQIDDVIEGENEWTWASKRVNP